MRAERTRLFRVAAPGVMFAANYESPSDSRIARSDPTYDDVDEELDDFFVMVQMVWRDAAVSRALCERWLTGAFR